MPHRWSLRCTTPELVMPAPVDPDGRLGPTPREARRVTWRRSSPGFYVPRDADRDVVEQRIPAEAMRLPPGGAVTGWAALRMAGGNFFDGTTDGRTQRDVDLVLPPPARLHAAPGIRVRRERLSPDEVVTRHGVPCTGTERALFDEIKWSVDVRAAVVPADMALSAQLTSRSALVAYVASRGGSRGAARARRVIDLAEDRVLSPQETPLRLIWMLDAGLPRPRCNWPVADASGRRIGRPDILSEEADVVGEYDGADHRERSRQADDVGKEDGYRNAGLECFRVVGRDLDDVGLVVHRMHGAVLRARRSTTPRGYLVRGDPGPL
jgi:hypothetical protein